MDILAEDYIKDLPRDILQHIGAIHNFEFMSKGNRCMRIISSEGKKYILKQIYLPASRVEEYKQICQKEILGFQKVIMVCDATNNKYWVLNEWVSGNTVCSAMPSLKNNEQKKIIKHIAESLREIHTEYQTETAVLFEADTLKNYLQCRFIDENTQELLSSYMLDKLPTIQKRHCTIVHGDFHTENIILTENGGITFIDMDDMRYGDPYIDLVYASNLICSADEYYTYYLLINYYFANNIPTDFWPIVNFYSVIKAISIMESEAEMNADGKPLLSIEGFVKQHSGFTEEQPLWYTRLHHKLGGV